MAEEEEMRNEPALAREEAWLSMRGLRPMSPITTTVAVFVLRRLRNSASNRRPTSRRTSSTSPITHNCENDGQNILSSPGRKTSSAKIGRSCDPSCVKKAAHLLDANEVRNKAYKN